MQIEKITHRKYMDPVIKCNGCGGYTANNSSRIVKNARCICAGNIINK